LTPITLVESVEISTRTAIQNALYATEIFSLLSVCDKDRPSDSGTEPAL